jgi:hypothetical protein
MIQLTDACVHSNIGLDKIKNTWVHNFNYIVVYKAFLKTTIFSKCTNVKNIVRWFRKEKGWMEKLN